MAIGTAGALIGGSVISGAMGARSAGKAADAQADAADKATDLQREIYYNDIERAQPFYQSGVNALAAYNYELGLGPDPRTTQQVVTVGGQAGGAAGQGGQVGGQTGMQGGAQGQPINGLDMSRVGAARTSPFAMGGIVAQDVGGSFQLTGPQGQNLGIASDLSEAQAIAARMGMMGGGQASGGPQRYMVGNQTFNTLEEAQAAANAGQNYRGFQETPGFQFALDKSQEAIDRAAAARGMRFSGATVNALAADAQGRQNQEYNNYLNRVGGLAGQGVQVTGQMANLGQNFASAAGQNALAAGNARASGYMGQQNAFAGTMNNIGTTLGYAQSGMFGPSPGFGITPNPAGLKMYGY